MPSITAQTPIQRFLQARIPTLLGLSVLVIGLVAGIRLVGSNTGGFLPRASEDAVPKQVRITNITDAGFTVSFITDLPAPGYIEYGTAQNKLSTQIKDDRDQLANSATEYPTHHITVRGLEANKQYYFRIGTGSRQTFDNNGQPFSVRTARKEAAAQDAKTAYGNVSSSVGNPANGSIVYLSIAGASPISALVQPNGSWAAPLSSVRTQDLSTLYKMKDTDTVRIQVQGTKRDEVIDVNAKVSNLMPLQTLTFGKENTITEQNQPGSTSQATPSKDASAQVTATPTPVPTVAPTSGSGSFQNLYNNQEASTSKSTSPVVVKLESNEVITTTKPEFVGSAPASSYLQLEVHSSQPYFGVVQTDASGNWKWAVPAALEPGPHTLKITYTDSAGLQQSIERTFTVNPNGSTSNLPAFTSSPSAILATPTPTPRPTATPVAATPTPKATTAPITPAPVATQSAQPVSGGTSFTWALLLIGISFFGFGMLSAQRFVPAAQRNRL